VRVASSGGRSAAVGVSVAAVCAITAAGDGVAAVYYAVIASVVSAATVRDAAVAV
jgi:hypothetical protein